MPLTNVLGTAQAVFVASNEQLELMGKGSKHAKDKPQ